MTQSNTWADQVRQLLDHANAVLQQGNRSAAADDMVRAAELLFLQAKKESDLEEKKRLVKRGTEILETSVRLADEVSANAFSAAESLMSLSSDPVRENVLAGALKELDAFIGLQSVKAEVAGFLAFLKIQKERKALGLKTNSNTLHYVFTGNPGTGKTTVARILAKILYGYGMLNSDKMIETDRQGLVGEYIGHTASKTDSVVQNALDGILFIDEAYALQNDSERDFGREAIDTLLKRMEDYRNRLVVIVAGYPALMDKFIKSNPGLSSRFTRYLCFEDYNTDELTQIFLKNCEAGEYRLTTPALERIRTVFDAAVAQKDEHFGNGRYVRNLFEQTTNNQHLRLSKLERTSREQLSTIEEEDIPGYPPGNVANENAANENCKVDTAAIINALRDFGFSEKEARGKMNIAIKDGFKDTEEIVKHILLNLK